MKKYSLFAIGALTAAALSGCSSDYLKVLPESDPASDQIVSSLEAAQMAVNGLSSAMNTQYQSTNYNQVNGEGYINFNFTDGFGPDMLCGLVMHWSPSMYNWKEFDDQDAIANSLPWMYSYNIINQANVVLDGIDTCPGDEKQRDFIKAQALTFRAHAYIKLMQFYGPRWEDSNNGAVNCVVLRTHAGTDDMPFSTTAQVMDQIYSDLQTAIELFDGCGLDRKYKWQVNGSVARGLFARAALIKHDWATAQKMAHDARQGYRVMDNDTYFSGFYQDCDDFMWAQGDNEADIYYWSLGSHYACNGQYTNAWGIGGVAISLDLYNQLDPNDVRRKLYLTPDKVNDIDPKANRGKIVEEDFWNIDVVDGASGCNMAAGSTARDPQNPNKKWGVINVIVNYAYKFANEYFKGNLSECDNEGFYAYCNFTSQGKVNLGNGVKADLVFCPMGSSLKFWSKAPYGTSKMPFMRASEMCITEAEAAYEAGDMATALSCLKEINDMRIPGYSFSGTGEALRDEIRLCRRIELWGEGNNFPDFKRWRLPMVRRAWIANDPTSGNYPTADAIEVAPEENHGWRFIVPFSETRYNKLVDIDQFYK